MRSTPHARTERLDFDVVFQVQAHDAEASESALEAIMVQAETVIAADPTLGGVTGLLWLRVVDYGVSSTQKDHMVMSTGLLTLRMVGRIDG